MLKIEALSAKETDEITVNISVEGTVQDVVQELIAVNVSAFQSFEIPENMQRQFILQFALDLRETYLGIKEGK